MHSKLNKIGNKVGHHKYLNYAPNAAKYMSPEVTPFWNMEIFVLLLKEKCIA